MSAPTKATDSEDAISGAVSYFDNRRTEREEARRRREQATKDSQRTGTGATTSDLTDASVVTSPSQNTVAATDRRPIPSFTGAEVAGSEGKSSRQVLEDTLRSLLGGSQGGDEPQNSTCETSERPADSRLSSDPKPFLSELPSRRSLPKPTSKGATATVSQTAEVYKGSSLADNTSGNGRK